MDKPAKPPIDEAKLAKLADKLAPDSGPVAWDTAEVRANEHALPGDIIIGIEQAEGVKCPRCWKIHPVRCNFDNLCDRCWPVILADHPNHESVPHILANLEEQRKRWGIKPECKCHEPHTEEFCIGNEMGAPK